MKGRFRKGKKAFKAGKKNKAANRYILYQEMRKVRFQWGMKLAGLAAAFATTAAKVNHIKNSSLSLMEKRLQMVNLTIQYAEQTANIIR